jgi:hypothetical protein
LINKSGVNLALNIFNNNTSEKLDNQNFRLEIKNNKIVIDLDIEFLQENKFKITSSVFNNKNNNTKVKLVTKYKIDILDNSNQIFLINN